MKGLLCPICGTRLTVHQLDGWAVAECPGRGCAYIRRLQEALVEAATWGDTNRDYYRH